MANFFHELQFYLPEVIICVRLSFFQRELFGRDGKIIVEVGGLFDAFKRRPILSGHIINVAVATVDGLYSEGHGVK